MAEKIGNVTMNYEYYNGSDDYSDGDIENEILDYVKNCMSSEDGSDYDTVMDILRKDNRWPVLYHLSPVRQNIIDWYDMKKGASVLEVGAGCGAVTAAICRQAAKVTSVELSKRRALINAYRNRQYKNLDIIVGNFNDIRFQETYDYITLIGVLEYANYFTGGEDSFVSFLKKIKTLLKPDGKLLIAIENKFGMKYFAGQAEDHTGRLFDGIEGYIGTDSRVRTFSKKELKDIVTEAGLPEIRYFYPFPDYKFPVQVFSEDYMPHPEDLVCSLDSYDNDRIHFFDETAVFTGIVKAGKFDFFSNSFFVEASLEKNEEGEEKIYSKITKDRRKEFQIETAVYRDNRKNEYKAVKRAITPEAEKHIAAMNRIYGLEKEKNGKKHFSATLCRSVYTGGRLEFEFVKGKSLCDKLLDSLKSGNRKEFEKLLFEYENMVYETAAAYSEAEGANRLKEVKGLNIDLTFDNIIEVNPVEYKIIDYEWCMQETIPVKYVLYRAVFAFYMRYQDMVSQYYTLQELLQNFGIGEQEAQDYYKQNLDFIDYVYDSRNGYNEILKAYKKNTIVFGQRILHHEYFAQLFTDSGAGFSEADSIKIPLGSDREYHTLEFDISGKNIKALRFDPFNIPAVIKLKEIEAEYQDGNRTVLPILSHNAAAVSTYSYMFESGDPQIILDISGIRTEEIRKLIIKMKVSLTNFEDYSEIFRLNDIRNFREYQKESGLLNRTLEVLEENRAVLPDIDKYYAVTRKLMDIEKRKPDNEKSLVMLTDTYAEESEVFIREMINLEYLRRDMEQQLKEALAREDRLKEELEYIKGTSAYRHLLDKKVKKVFEE